MASSLFTILLVVGAFLVILNVVMVYAAFATLGSDDHRAQAFVDAETTEGQAA
ncbi:MAG: hypothetical protein R3324_06975 [Halobacteriales archaeon]|nr:hypothetical protein [Halobacteriales archaeon]